MEILRKLPDQVLLDQTSALVKVERETTTQILHHLQELERRRLFAVLGFSSLFSYCVESLGYSESSAQRRISSMRLLKSLEPEVSKEVEIKIQEGSLSLSVLAQAQSFFQEEAKANHALSPLEKKEVLGMLDGKSARAATQELKNLSSQEVPPIREYARSASHDRTEIHLVVNQQTMETLEKIKGLLAHSHPNIGWGDLIGKISEIAWQKLDPSREPLSRKKNTTPLQEPSAEGTTESSLMTKSDIHLVEQTAVPTSAVKRERISTALKRDVWRKSEGKCTYVDSVTGKACNSRRFLQIEHLRPVALGGKNELSNCTLRCSVHNQLSAIQIFSQKKMEKYVPSLR